MLKASIFVLPGQYRMRSSRQFRTVMRGGRRFRAPTVAMHLLRAADTHPRFPEPRVGFAVSARVGDAVVRNRVRRRLRHIVARHVLELPGGSALVVRALEPAGQASSQVLAGDVEDCLRHLLGDAG